MNSIRRTESPWISLPWYPESWNSSVKLWILAVSWLPAALPGAGALLMRSREEPRFGVLGSLPLLLSSHWIVALGKFLWPWLNTPGSLPGEHRCQPHPWALGVRQTGEPQLMFQGAPWHKDHQGGTGTGTIVGTKRHSVCVRAQGSSGEWEQRGRVLPGHRQRGEGHLWMGWT